MAEWLQVECWGGVGDMGGPGWWPGLAGADAHGNGEWLLLFCCFSYLTHLGVWTGVKPDHITSLPSTSSESPLENVGSFWKDIDLRIRKHTESCSLYAIRGLQAPVKSLQSWIKGAPLYSPSLYSSWSYKELEAPQSHGYMKLFITHIL